MSRKRSRVINPGDGKGPRIWCGRCAAYVGAVQKPWPKADYMAAPHEHTKEVAK